MSDTTTAPVPAANGSEDDLTPAQLAFHNLVNALRATVQAYIDEGDTEAGAIDATEGGLHDYLSDPDLLFNRGSHAHLTDTEG